MWIKGTNVLIQTDALDSVRLNFEGSLDSAQRKCHLCVSYRNDGGDGYDVIDSFEDEQEAKAAKDWFYLVLTGEIDKDEWEQGRNDTLAREAILERKETAKRRSLMSPSSSLDQAAYLGAVSEAGRAFVEYYEDVLAPDREKFLELLRAFRKVQIAMAWPAPNAQKRLVEIFEKGTGIEYDGELNT